MKSLPQLETKAPARRGLSPALLREITGTSRASLLLWPALILAAVVVAFAVTDNYWLQVIVNAEIMVIAAVGLYVTFGLSGQVSLGQAGFYALGGYGTGLLISHFDIPFLFAMIAGVALAALVGLALGIPALRLKGHYLALVTLGFGQVVALVLINWTWLTGGATGVRDIVAPLIGSVALKTVPHWAVFIGLLAVAAVYIVHRIHHSSYGRVMRAVRDNGSAAAAMGVSLPRVKVLAFAVGAAFAGLAGALNAGFVTYISPGTYTLQLSVTMLSMVVVGGAKSPWGAVAGAFLLTFLPELLRDFQDYYLLFYGVLLLVAVAFVPQGIWGVALSVFTRLRRMAGNRQRAAAADAEEGDVT